jgi:ATP-dependent helicase/nuclease subunit B
MPSLRLVPYGPAAVAALREAIAAAKGDDPLQPVTVAVPSNYAGLSLRRTLGATGRGLVNVRFIVLPRIAELLGSPALAAEGKRPLTSPVRAEAVRAVVAADPGIFEAVADHVATERSLESTFRDLRRAPESALASVERQGKRAAHVVRLFRDFRHRTQEYYDEEDLALAAAAAARSDALALRDVGHVIVYLPRRLSPAEQKLLEALAGAGRLTVIIGLTGDSPADTLPRRIAAQLEAALGPVEETAATDNVSKAHIVTVTDAEEEVRTVLRLIMERLATGTPLHRVAVLYRASQPYALLAQEQFRAAGIPCNGPGTRTLAQTLTGRALLGLLRLRETGFRRDILMDWLSSAPILEDSGQPAPAQRWDLLSRSAGVVRGASQWQERLTAHRRSLEKERRDLEETAEASEGQMRHLEAELDQVERLGRFIDELTRRLDPRETKSWPGFAAWARGLLERYLGGEGHQRDWPETEIESHRAVTEAPESLSALNALRPQIDEAIFRRALERELEATAGRIGRFGEGVFIGRTVNAIGTDFDVIYLLGMRGGVAPLRGEDDPLLPDREREAAGEAMSLRAGRATEYRRDYLAALASAPERVLLYPRADLRGQRGQLPSTWLLDEGSRLEGKALYSSDFDPPPSREWLTVVPSFQAALAGSGEPASEQEYDLRSLLRFGGPASSITNHYLVEETPALKNGITADFGRQSARLTRWDGAVQSLEMPAPSQERPASPTALQNWAACPFRYFLGNILRIAETEKPEETLTLSALDRGTLLHEALETFIREAPPRAAPNQSWSDEERARLVEIGERLCDEAVAAGITGKRLLWRLERERIRRDLVGFLDADEEMRREKGCFPINVEMGFGMGTAGSGPPALITLTDGRTIALRGKMDRLDRTPDGSRLLVFDYKSGSAGYYFGLDKDPLKRGKLLQLPIYALAARQSYDNVSEVEAYYWFISEDQDYARRGYTVDESILVEFHQAIDVIVSGIASGLFPARPGKARQDQGTFENCSLCPYDRICPRLRARLWERKRSAPELKRYLEMAEGDE